MKDHIVSHSTYGKLLDFDKNNKPIYVGNRVGEINTKPSQTIPGMTLSLQELLKRYVKGDPVVLFEPVYLGEDDTIPDNLELMDEIQRLEMSRDIKEAIKTHQQKKPAQKAPAELPLPPEDPSM